MEGLARQEYPGMLASLPPAQAVNIFNERIKRIGRINTEIADWLQERRKVEELYVQGLKKLARRQPPDNQSELGVFTTPWNKMISLVDETATSHAMFAQQIEKDVEQSLRTFPAKNKEMASVATIQGNLQSLAKDYEQAQDGLEKLQKKGSKANQSKTQQATTRLSTATSDWEIQAPFIFEKLQAIDESRINHLRDVLTQYQTHEADQVERNRVATEATLNALLEVDTTIEILTFAANATQGKPRIERRPPGRTGSTVSAGSASLALPPPRMHAEDSSSLHSARNDAPSEHKKESGLKRFGTMLGRRRQSIHAGSFGRSSSPSKGFSALGPPPRSRDGRPAPSPRASSSNLRDTTRQNSSLGAVAESPTSQRSPRSPRIPPPLNESVNGDAGNETVDTTRDVNGASAGDHELTKVATPPPAPPQFDGANASATQRDAEGFSVPPAANDPISQAQREAINESESAPAFKLNIAQQAIHEEDADAQAALSSVANTLRSANVPMPTRKLGTLRGRRDVRNTMYIPAPEAVIPDAQRSPSAIVAPSPGINRVATLGASASDLGSSADSIRSAGSAGGSLVKHPEMTSPGLNSSIIETVNLLTENGEIKSATIVGEIALCYIHPVSVPEIPDTASIRLYNFQALEAIAPNKAFVNELPVPDRPGEYTVQLSQTKRTNCAFKYKVHTEPSTLNSQIPLLLKPAWKPTGGDKLGVIVEYTLNPAYSLETLTVNNLTLIVSYEGRAINAQTKPSGTHVKDKNVIFWRLGDVMLEPGVSQRVVGRLLGDQGGQPLPGVVEAKWEIAVPSGSLVGSGLGVSWKAGSSEAEKGKGTEPDPFADEDAGKSVEDDESNGWARIISVRKIVSGKYDAITGAEQA